MAIALKTSTALRIYSACVCHSAHLGDETHLV